MHCSPLCDGAYVCRRPLSVDNRGCRRGDQTRDDAVLQPTRRRKAAQIVLARTAPLPRGAVLLAVTSCLLTGCSFVGAPSFELFGAYFPAWMLCSLIGILGAASTRMVLTTPAINEVIPLQLAVCTAVGVIAALLSWMALVR